MLCRLSMINGMLVSSNNPIILDTHTLLWTLIEPDQLNKTVSTVIQEALDSNNLIIASISLWEIAMLKMKKRIKVYEPIKDFLQTIEKIPGLQIQDISASVAAESTLLLDNFHGDPADRLIVASTIVNSATLVTRDEKILEWAKHGSIKTLEA